MPYYTTSNGDLYYLDVGVSAEFTPVGSTLITDTQAATIQSATTARLAHSFLISTAQEALNKSDTTVIRCYSAGVAVPATWQTYRASLRAIVNGTDTTSTALPATPTYPSGT